MFFHLGDLNTFDIDSSGRRFFFFLANSWKSRSCFTREILESMSESELMPSYPSPNLTLTLTC